MWINETYVKEQNVILAEAYVQDCSYGIKINGIPIEIGFSTERYTDEEKAKHKQEVVDLIKGFIE